MASTFDTHKISGKIHKRADFYGFCPSCGKIVRYDLDLKIKAGLEHSHSRDENIPTDMNFNYSGVKIKCPCGIKLKIYDSFRLCTLDGTLHEIGSSLVSFGSKNEYTIVYGGRLTKASMKELYDKLKSDCDVDVNYWEGNDKPDSDDVASLPHITLRGKYKDIYGVERVIRTMFSLDGCTYDCEPDRRD